MEIEDPAAPVAALKPSQVPAFGSDSDRPKMNAQQKSFYLEEFLPGLLAGNPVDVQGNSGYAGELVFELMEQRRNEPVVARERLVELMEAYEWRELPSSLDFVLAGFFFLEGDFAAGYAALDGLADPSLHLSLAAHGGQLQATASQAFHWAESGPITSKGIRMLDAVFDELQKRLDAFHTQNGASMLADFWRRLTAEGAINDVAASIEDDLLLTYTGEEVRVLLERGREDCRELGPPRAFDDWPEYAQPIAWPAPWVRSQQYYWLIRARFRGLVREAENAAREAVGMLRVGERWTSEMKLFREIQEAFPEERVVHQARPWWLKPQSLDIYFTDHNVAIEYQGAQHSRPVEFFGGEEAFEDLQQRDADKAYACEQYGCTLIAVHPGYRLADVLDAVRQAVEGKRGV